MAITFDTWRIIIATNGTKGTSSNPYTIADVYAESEANGWGIERIGDTTKGVVYSYMIPWGINVAANTYFKIEFTTIIFKYYSTSRPQIFNNSSSSYITINQSVLRHDISSAGDTCNLYLFNATITNSAIYDFYGQTYYAGCNISRTLLRGWVSFYSGAIYSNCLFLPQVIDAVDLKSSPETINNCQFFVRLRTTYLTTGTWITIRNARIEHTTPFILVTSTYNYTDKGINLIDCYTTDKNFTYTPSSLEGKNITVNCYSTFQFDFENAENAAITIYDKNNSIVYTGIYEDGLSEEILYYKIYCEVPNSPVISDLAPFSIKIEKEGYQYLLINDIEIVEPNPTILRGRMLENIPEKVIVSSIQTNNPGTSNLDGTITVFADKGTHPYLYKINDSDYQESNVFQNLPEGVYTLYVKDADNIVASVSGVALKKTTLYNLQPPLSSINKQIPAKDLKALVTAGDVVYNQKPRLVTVMKQIPATDLKKTVQPVTLKKLPI